MRNRIRTACVAIALACLIICVHVLHAQDPVPEPQDPPAPPVAHLRVQMADGSSWVGTMPAGTEWQLVEGEFSTAVRAGQMRCLMVSTMTPADGLALAEKARELIRKLGDDTFEVREAATRALGRLGPGAAPFVVSATLSANPEVRMRARDAMEQLTASGAPCDPRDYVLLTPDKPEGPNTLGGTVLRGWLTFDAIELQTALGAVRLPRNRIRMITAAAISPENLAGLPDGSFYPPMAEEKVRVPLQVSVTITGGTQLTGIVTAESLDLLDGTGQPIPSPALSSMVRMTGGEGIRFRQTCKDGQTISGRLAVTELVLDTRGGRRTLPVAAIESLVVGPPKAMVVGDRLRDLVQRFLQAEATGGAKPALRFWVHINDQPANPWNSKAQMGMTWSLRMVQGHACMVGSDDKTDAYKGDTSIGSMLPILAVRRANLPKPSGVDASGFYKGWSGAEIRLTKPVSGEDLHSLAAANKIVKAEFGEDWEMAEFHMGNGGWAFWGLWDPSGR